MRESAIVRASRPAPEPSGVADALHIEDSYIADEDLCDHLQAADLYVTPYTNAEQITSGTLAYALACGVPMLSTPYWHAQEASLRMP